MSPSGVVFLDKLVTGDEKWILYYDGSFKEADLHKTREGDFILSVEGDIQETVHYELLNKDQTITSNLNFVV